MKYIGIDLAWTYKNETGFCIISEAGNVEYLESRVFTDQDIVSLIKSYSHENVCIAIDAPLIVRNEEGSREAERELMGHKIHGYNLSVFVANRKFLNKSFGMIRGEKLMNLIIEEIPNSSVNVCPVNNTNTIVETFPTAICCGLFPDIYPVKYKIKKKNPFEETKIQMARLIERLKFMEETELVVSGLIEKLKFDKSNITKSSYKHLEDKIDAFLSAYGIYSISKNLSERLTFGDERNGFITIPIVNKKSEYIEASISKSTKSSINSDDIIDLTISVGELASSINNDLIDRKRIVEKLKRKIMELQKKI